MPGIQDLDGQYDYIIVGAGTAGCVLANRLTEDPRIRVLLLEAGRSDSYHWVRIPVGYLYCMGNPRTDWMMKTAPEPGLNGRSLVYPRGKVLGGCSSINGMIYMRGQAADYDHWRQLGNAGWAWDDVLPYFLKSEDHHAGTSAMHAAGGGWKVSKQRLRWEILESVQEGAKEFGIQPRADFKRRRQRGFGLLRSQPAQGRALEHRRRLPAAGDEAAQPAGRRPGRDRTVDRRRPRDPRRGLPAQGRTAPSARAGRGPGSGGVNQLAQAPGALRYRSARAPRRARHRSGP